MIELANRLWVGNSRDAETAPVGAILNVASDLRPKRLWPDVEYMQVGLIDGPGNPLTAYYATVFALETLMQTGKRVLVHCHEGKSRSVSVVLMYLNAVNFHGWDEMIELVQERIDIDLPKPNEAHRVAFDNMDWEMLKRCIC